MTKYLIALSLLSPVTAFTQAREYAFKLEMLMDGDRSKPAGNTTFLFNGTRQVTNSEGMAYITFDNKSSPGITIRSIDEREYAIVGNETIHVPERTDITTTISLVRTAQKQAVAAQQLDKLLKQQKMDRRDMDSLRRLDASLFERMLQKQDSILKSIMHDFKMSESELRSARELMEGRDKYFGLLSQNLEGYLNEAKDVRDAFQNLVTYALDNPKSFKLLDSTINIYNKYYNDLNNNNAEWEKAVLDYWKSYELSMGYHNLVDFAINNIHRASILPLNSTIIRKINLYLNEKSRKKREDLKQALTSDLNGIIPAFDNNIGILDVKIKSYVSNLKAKKDFQVE